MFQGYSDKTVDFFWQIRFNNNREWFAAHKQEFQEVIQQPTKELANELYEWLRETWPQLNLNLHISRIYRDARRLFGQGPLKDQLWFSFQSETENRNCAPCFYFEVGADGYGYGFGFYSATAAMAARYRRLVDLAPEKLDALAAKLEKQQTFTLQGPTYAKCKGHKGERIEPWYNKKYWSLCCERSYDELVSSRELVDEIKKGFEFLLPYYQYMENIYKMAE